MQNRLLGEGEALLRRGAPAHNHFSFYRDAVEAMITRPLLPLAESALKPLQR